MSTSQEEDGKVTEDYEEYVDHLPDNDNEFDHLPDSEDDDDFDVDNFPGRYCGKEFETNLKWESRDDLVDWVKKMGKELMMCLVIQRSTIRYVSLVCEHFGEQRLRKKKSDYEDEGEREIVVETREGTHTKKSGCTFRLVGVPEKKSKHKTIDRKWILRIVSGVHNHKLLTHFQGHAIIGQLTEQEKILVRSLGESYVPPSAICNALKISFPGNVTSPKQVSNYLQKVQFVNRGDLTVTQWTLNFLKLRKYEVFPLRENRTNEVDVLFFAHVDSLKLLKRFPYVIVIDATYKTNKYNMPLVEIVGFTCTHKTFNIAYAFTKKEEIVHYTFIMRKLHYLCEEAGVMPTAIMTDREKSLINAIHIIFPEAKHLLCWVHIKHNIEAYCSPLLKNREVIKAFCGQCWGLFCSYTEESYEKKLEELKNTWNPGLVRYVEKWWLTPYKENIVRAWTDHHLHFFTRTSNRVEGMHKVLKRIVDSSIGGFSRMVVRIDSAIDSQVCKIKASMEISRIKMPTQYNKMKPHIKIVFSRLFYRVSDRGLMTLYHIYELLIAGKFKEECDDYWMTECLGLPCLHTIARAIIERRPIMPSEIHRFWKQIDWDRIIRSDADNVTGDDVNMTVGEMRCNEFSQKFQRGELKKSTIEHMGEVFTDLEYPNETTLLEPTMIKPKGRPKGSTKWSTKRDPSGFEYAREDVDKMEKAKEVKKGNKRGSQVRSQRKEKEEHDDVEGSQVYNDHEEVSGSQSVGEPITHLGMDFGVNNIDYFWYPFIKEVKDVAGDGHCGYRSMSVLLGGNEENYKRIRLTLASHLVANRSLYEPALARLNPGKSYDSYVISVNYMLSPFPQSFWCDMPMAGLAFATVYQVALAFLSWNGPCLCLPMMTSQSRLDGDGLRILAMAQVGKQNHFIPIWLTDGSPLPPTPYAWHQFKHISVEGWDETFASRISMFRDFRVAYGRSAHSLV